ncbi:MAG: ribbon-helix-helix domain-containing protein [Propionibacteriaceae bacterium]|jgi:plasmid stability protein|nr:ribbon-helix-helix domain-containing protein [Propionibacteriaceae bacterium]
MTKTTIYLEDDLKAAVSLAALDARVSEAEAIRAALRAMYMNEDIPAPQGGVFEGGQVIEWNNDDYLRGFGE